MGIMFYRIWSDKNKQASVLSLKIFKKSKFLIFSPVSKQSPKKGYRFMNIKAI